VIVILEGPDNSGKTHLAEQLVKRIGTNVEVIHNGPPPEKGDLLQHYCDQVTTAHLKQSRDGRTTIFDRLALSEVIYGSIIRGGHRLGRDGYRKFADICDVAKVKTVILTTPWDTVCDLWKQRQAEEYVQDKGLLFDIWEAYQSRANNLRSPGAVPIAYNWQTTSFETLWQELNK
jgi:thymidylate kinase